MKKFSDQRKNQPLKYGQTIYISPGDHLTYLCMTGDGFIKNEAVVNKKNKYDRCLK